MICVSSGVTKSGLDHLATWHLPGGPVGPASRLAATSNVELCQINDLPVNREKVVREGEKGARDSHKKRIGKEGVGTGEASSGSLAREEGCTWLFVHPQSS